MNPTSSIRSAIGLILVIVARCLGQVGDSIYYNPVLSGWHSDPSCVHVDGTFYCVTSTLISFPGLPVYASNDLINWRLISHVWNRESQMPGASRRTKGQQEGFYAATIRHHVDKFWVVCEYLGLEEGMLGTVFTSPNPFDETAWSDPSMFLTQAGDLDLFWDDDNTLYIAGSVPVKLQRVDLETGEILSVVEIWAGSGGVWPEGPHLYRKDGWYYLTLAEGGTELGHYQLMARSRNLTGPYEPCPFNPVLTNKDTDEYFQTVGHLDIFEDKAGNFWGVALATRSGPEWFIYPMGRETVLVPMTWEENEWPVFSPVRGKMDGTNLPLRNSDPPGDGPLNHAPDVYDFPPNADIPRNLIYWRVPFEDAFSMHPDGGLVIRPSAGNLTGDDMDMDGRQGLSFIARRQTHTLFDFHVDIQANLPDVGQEAGIAIFLTQKNHIDLGLVTVPGNSTTNMTQQVIRLRATGENAPEEAVLPVPNEWGTGLIRFEASAINSTHYSLAVSSASESDTRHLMGTVSARLLSGQSGPFTGTLLGAYATCNGIASYSDCAASGEVIIKEWRYTGTAQFYSETEVVLVA